MSKTLQRTFKLRAAIEAAARHWWEQQRPVGWTIEQHLEHPRVNTTSPSESALAIAVARVIRVEHET
ncbi:MAG: hypothetical protein HY749_15900 [Gammaproteobacteria bacterium]|nr:hypothetical protein [Gammaproteobacteria bacterium]